MKRQNWFVDKLETHNGSDNLLLLRHQNLADLYNESLSEFTVSWIWGETIARMREAGLVFMDHNRL